MEAKVQLIAAERDVHGLNACCRALGISKSSFYWHTRPKSVDPEEEEVKTHIRQIIAEHPGYGWRRIQPELVERLGKPVNHKRVRRLLRTMELALARSLPKPSPNPVDAVLEVFEGSLNLVKGEEFGELEVLSTDFTELVYAEGSRKAHLMVYLDIVSRVAVGWAVGASANTELALEAWERARDRLERWQVNLDRVIVHSDKDGVYRSHAYVRQLLVDDGVALSFSERGAKDNPWVESMWGRLKVELGSAMTCSETLKELVEVVEAHLRYYNRRRRHSGLDHQIPLVALAEQLEEVADAL